MAVQNAFCHDWPHVRISFWATSFIATVAFEPETIPPANLTKLNLQCHLSFLRDGREKLNALVVASKHLRSLHLYDDLHFRVEFGKVPPITELDTGSWSYKALEVEEIWDFSKLRKLSLGHTMNFVDSVKPNMFPVLRELRVMENDFYSEIELRSSSAKLSAFISHLDQLEELDVVTYDPAEVIKSLRKHQKSLRSFGISGMYLRISNIGMQEVKNIVGLCPKLIELRLTVPVPGLPELYGEMSLQVKYNMESIDILAALRSLRRIDLRWTVSTAESMYYDELGSQLANHLATRKKGLHVENFALAVEAPLLEDIFEDYYEWDANGQLVPDAEVLSYYGDESSSVDGESNEEGEED